MPIFRVLPRGHEVAAQAFVAGDSGQILNMVHRPGWDVADVRQDGQYLCSVALDRDGVWLITRERPEMESNVLPFSGAGRSRHEPADISMRTGR